MWGFFCLFLHSANSGEDFLDLGSHLFFTSSNSKVIINFNMDNPGTRQKALNNAIQM